MSGDPDPGFARLRTKWEMEVGRFLLRFGEVESVVSRFLIDLPTERIYESVGRSRLSSRIQLVRQIASRKDLPADLVADLEKLLQQASTLSHDRNIVAHNPLYWSFFDEEGGVSFKMNIVPFAKPDKQISLERLTELANEAEVLSDELHVLASKIGDKINK